MEKASATATLRRTLQITVSRGKRQISVHEFMSNTISVGAGSDNMLIVDGPGIESDHLSIVGSRSGEFWLLDRAPARQTLVNGRPVRGPLQLAHGDRIQLGEEVALALEFLERNDASQVRRKSHPPGWHPDSWKAKPAKQLPQYSDLEHLQTTIDRLRRSPPLVTSWEVEELRQLIADAQAGRRFVLQGGDCAETLADCTPDLITAKLKILFHMSLVLVHGARKPVVRIARLAGQYAKPRSSLTEVRDGLQLPSYLGDLVNSPEFTPEARRPNPELLFTCYQHAAMTLNFVRALGAGGFADLRQAEHLDLSVFEHANLPEYLRDEYRYMSRQIADGLQFVRSLGERASAELTRAKFFTSHEGLNLYYEAALTRTVPRRVGFYNLSTHMPWLGERTRDISGAHVEFFRGISNPIGIKVGPSADPAEIVRLCQLVNPENDAGKVVLITRMGASKVMDRLPPIVEEIRDSGQLVLWMSDPMHGNGMVTSSGLKTRHFGDILRELESTFDIHDECGTVFGGVHFELTGENVTECLGAGTTESDLDTRYLTACDPRLNYRQSMELAFCVARRMQDAPSMRRVPSVAPVKY